MDASHHDHYVAKMTPVVLWPMSKCGRSREECSRRDLSGQCWGTDSSSNKMSFQLILEGIRSVSMICFLTALSVGSGSGHRVVGTKNLAVIAHSNRIASERVHDNEMCVSGRSTKVEL